MNFLFISRKKEFPTISVPLPAQSGSIALNKSCPFLLMSMERLSRTSKELGFENHKDMDLEGTMLLSDYSLWFVFIYICCAGRSCANQIIASGGCSSHCKPLVLPPIQNLSAKHTQSTSWLKDLVPHLPACLCWREQ